MAKKRSIYIIIILVLIAAIIVAYYYKMRNNPAPKEDIKTIVPTDKEPEDTTVVDNSNYEEEITAKKADNIDGFEVYEYTKPLNGKSFNVKVSFNTKKETVEENEKISVIYQIYLNDYLVNNASGFYYLDIGSEADAYAFDIKDTDINVLKGKDNKEYLVVNVIYRDIINDVDTHKVYIINEFARLLGVLTLDKDILMHKLVGTNSDEFLINNEYYYYVILENKIIYLTSESGTNYRGYSLTINNHQIIDEKNYTYVGSDYEDDGYGSVTLKTY